MQAQYIIAIQHIIKINSKRYIIIIKRNRIKNTTKDCQLKCIYVLCLVKCGLRCKLVRVFTNITVSKIACNTIKVNKM